MVSFKYYIILNNIILYYISFHLTSFHFILFCFILFYFVSFCFILFHLILLYFIILSYLILSYLILSYCISFFNSLLCSAAHVMPLHTPVHFYTDRQSCASNSPTGLAAKSAGLAANHLHRRKIEDGNCKIEDGHCLVAFDKRQVSRPNWGRRVCCR
jgi:hypothetical protein